MTKDYLWLHLRELPYFRALLRAVEARLYKNLELPTPVLDIGCGDGHFAGIAFEHRIQTGIDNSLGSLREAKSRKSYKALVQGRADILPFTQEHFASAVSNSVLEHIPDVETVLSEISRVLKPDALFIFCVPNHTFLSKLSIARLFDRTGFPFLAEKYRQFFNKISRHIHCDSPSKWEERLKNAGFVLEEHFHYFSPRAFKVMEWGHYFGLPCLIIRFITRKWILAPYRWNLFLTEKYIRPYYEEVTAKERGVYTFYKARKMK